MNILKFSYIIGVVSTIFMCALCAQIEYRQATLGDIPTLVELFDRIEQTPEDAQKLVIHPRKVRAEILREHIIAGHFFVATDDERNHALIAFLKTYLISGPAEKHTIVHNELRVNPEHILAHHSLFFSPTETIIGDSIDRETQEQDMRIVLSQDHPGDQRELYFYYGSAYTDPAYRGHLVNFNLHMYALSSLVNNTRQILVQFPSIKHLILLYGQHESNKNHKGMTLAFSHFAHNVIAYGDPLSARFYAFKSCKPTLYLEDEQVKAHFDEETGRGQGCVVIYPRGSND